MVRTTAVYTRLLVLREISRLDHRVVCRRLKANRLKAAMLPTPMNWKSAVDDLANYFARQDVVQHGLANEVNAEEAPSTELEGGADDEGRCTKYDLDDGILECGADSH